MKKIICLALLLSLLLTGCGIPSITPVTEPTAETMEASLNTPSESMPSSEADNFHVGVYTDFSVYSKEDEPLPSPLYTVSKDAADQLPFATPRNLYPYAGSILRDRQGYDQGFLYGLVDRNGTLITLPIYNSIDLLYNNRTKSYSPFWVVQKYEKATEQWEDGTFYDYQRTKHGLVSMDGTFVLDCIYDNISLYEDRILCSRDAETTGSVPIVEAYDTTGILRFSTEDHSFDSALSGSYASYGEGLYILSFKDNSPDAEAYDTCDYFVAEDGKVLYGPYYSASPFHDGIASVSLDFNQVTYLRRDGTLFPETYAYANSFENGFAIVTDEHWNNGLIDTNGDVYIAPAGNITHTVDGAYIAWGQGEAGALPTRCYDEYGNFLWESQEEWAGVLSRDLIYHSTQTSTTVKSILTGREITLPVDAVGEYQPHAEDPYVVLYSFQPTVETFTHYILTSDLEIFAEVSSPNMFLSESVNIIGKDNYGFALRDGNQVTLYESPNNPIGSYSMPSFQEASLFPDGTVSFTLENYTEFYDKDGNLFLRYTFDPMDD